jgi:hypothetical protein
VLSRELTRPSARPPDRHWSRTVLLHAPTPLALPDLTRRVADEVRAGRAPVVDPARRWYRRLPGHGDHVGVWLISWATEQAAELHDHGGSLGALTVVTGGLVERRRLPTGMRTRSLAEGRTAAFPLGHVHDVGNPYPAPAVSVHAYSPSLTAMSYYAVDARGQLRRTRSVLTEENPG